MTLRVAPGAALGSALNTTVNVVDWPGCSKFVWQ